MKKIYLFLLLLATVVTGCKKPYEEQEIGDPIYSAAHALAILNGKWGLRKASQIDEKSLVKEAIDITDFFTQGVNSKAPNISFNTTAYTYTSDTAGVVEDYFGASGTWKFDNAAYPTKIILSSGTQINIGANIESTNAYLAFERSFSCGTEKSMSYKLELVKN